MFRSLESGVFGFLLIGLTGAFLSGCGKSGSVSIKSGAFNTTGGVAATGGQFLGATAAPSATPVDVTDFKFCVTQLKLDNEQDKAEEKDGKEDIEFRPGLIDITNGATKDWGKVDVPTGFKLKRLKIEVHHDPELCQVPYSVKFNNLTTQQDVEFKFRFDPPIDLNGGDTLTLGFSTVVDSLRTAATNGALSVGDDLKTHIESLEDHGSK